MAAAADALLAVPIHALAYMDLCNTLLGEWNATLQLAYPTNNTSNRTTNNSNTGGIYSSSSSSSNMAEARLLHLAQGLPAMVKLAHRYLRQPPSRWCALRALGRERMILGDLTSQLQELMDSAGTAAAAADRVLPCGNPPAEELESVVVSPPQRSLSQATTQGSCPVSLAPALRTLTAPGPTREQVGSCQHAW
jgi:hypothetical protein